MKRKFYLFIALAFALSACTAAPRVIEPTHTIVPTLALPTVTATFTPTATLTPTHTPVPPTPTVTLTPTPAYPPEGRGPTGFAPEINPLPGR